MSDFEKLIYASDLIEWIMEAYPDWCVGAIRSIVDHVNELPSAQSERKKGEWIDYTDEGYVECPFCHSATNCDDNIDELHFCFSCGAEMRRGEANE